MGIEFDDNRPIYQQLMTRICREIIRGERESGEKLPSVREYAVDVGVNANTIQRVYRELEQEQIVESRRGQGTFITTDKQRLVTLREAMKQELIQQFSAQMQEMGYSHDEMIHGIEQERKEKA
ncbi:GntR family transcriptional regulator [Lentibacillus sp. N15]|uniref:GntR family transcriptional regulator n=1 Tax=Lentibacillus songyuanensis TaxID=3136161 RepID=UPI0031BA7640